jgi:hypothetical protein
MRFKERLEARRLERAIRRGKQTWGRQPSGHEDPGPLIVPMKGHATISAVVIRRDQAGNVLSTEDLGVISETEWDEGMSN